jgi:hypothetical protein
MLTQDVDQLFGENELTEAPPPKPAEPAAAPVAPERGGRAEQRAKVSWPARMHLRDGRVVPARVRDVSESGLGLVADIAPPAGTEFDLAVGLPSLDKPGQFAAIVGRVRVSYAAIAGREIKCGCLWTSLAPDARQALLQRLRR